MTSLEDINIHHHNGILAIRGLTHSDDLVVATMYVMYYADRKYNYVRVMNLARQSYIVHPKQITHFNLKDKENFINENMWLGIITYYKMFDSNGVYAGRYADMEIGEFLDKVM